MPLFGDMKWIAAQVAPDTSEAAMQIAAWRAATKLRKTARSLGHLILCNHRMFDEVECLRRNAGVKSDRKRKTSALARTWLAPANDVYKHPGTTPGLKLSASEIERISQTSFSSLFFNCTDFSVIN